MTHSLCIYETPGDEGREHICFVFYAVKGLIFHWTQYNHRKKWGELEVIIFNLCGNCLVVRQCKGKLWDHSLAR